MEAADLDQLAAAKRLIVAGADVNARDQLGATTLMLAARNGNATLVDALIAQHADVNATGRDGRSVLQFAQLRNQTMVLRRLQAAGTRAPVSQQLSAERLTLPTTTPGQAYHDWPALNVAASSAVDARDPEGYTALMRAAWKGHTALLQMLLDARADGGLTLADGTTTALLLAARGGQSTAVATLIAGGADVNQRSTDHMSALLYAARGGDVASVASVRALLAHGAGSTAPSTARPSASSIDNAGRRVPIGNFYRYHARASSRIAACTEIRSSLPDAQYRPHLGATGRSCPMPLCSSGASAILI